MIVQELLSEDLIRTYSDSGMYIHGGFPEADYEEAIDPVSTGRTYVETDIPIPEPEIPEPTVEDIEDMRNALGIMGIMP